MECYLVKHVLGYNYVWVLTCVVLSLVFLLFCCSRRHVPATAATPLLDNSWRARMRAQSSRNVSIKPLLAVWVLIKTGTEKRTEHARLKTLETDTEILHTRTRAPSLPATMLLYTCTRQTLGCILCFSLNFHPANLTSSSLLNPWLMLSYTQASSVDGHCWKFLTKQHVVNARKQWDTVFHWLQIIQVNGCSD